MQANIKVTDNLWIEAEVGDQEVDLFKALSKVERLKDILGSTKCGKCNNPHIKYVCRPDSDDNEWLEIACKSYKCRAKLIYGQAKKGGVVYPKIKWKDLSKTQQEQRIEEKAHADANNDYLPNGGWFIWQGKKEE